MAREKKSRLLWALLAACLLLGLAILAVLPLIWQSIGPGGGAFVRTWVKATP
jgi:hypothetical protein